MTVFNYSANSAVAFDALNDSLNFDSLSISAADLQFQPSGASLLVGVNGQFMTLLNTSYASLVTASLSFANGSLFFKDTVGTELFNGSAQADYFDLSGGGDDQAGGGNGNDVFNVGAALSAADRISGGAGSDTLRLAGNYAAPVVFNATTVTGVENFLIGAGGTVRLTLQDGIFTDTTGPIAINASGQSASDSLVLDASQLSTLNNPSYAYLNVITGAGNDSVYTGTGNDLLGTGAGNDVLHGGGGHDTLYAGIGNDVLWGESGNDTLNGDDGDDTLEGGDDNDTLSGGAGNDVLFGGAGNDILVGGMDADTLTGGTGNDTFTFGFGSPRTESSQSTVDTITDFAVGDKIDLPGTNYINSLPLAFVEAQTAFRTDDQAFNAGNLGVRPGSNPGDGFVDVMWRYSAALNQVELWVDGNDDGQFSEVDTFVILKSDVTGKTTFTGADLVDNFVAWRGTDGGDNFGPGTAGINIAADNLAYGLDGNDVLDGGLGSDQLYGGLGNDQLIGGEGSDSLYGGSGADTLDGGNGSDSLSAEGENAPGVSGVDAPGTVNTLNGGAGNDYLSGGAGDDQLNGQADDDSLSGGAGVDVLVGDVGNDTLYGGDGNDTLDGGDGNDTLNGDAGTDSLFGGAGNDTL
ncbi:calcium-binding protein, partial [Roseateles albus]|nr:calcium-binding protein [Roseateles albus]